jgi:SAM-dependent methyltransferase
VPIYAKKADKFIQQYESLDPTEVHKSWSKFLPEVCSSVLDVGAGSGRDARWLASYGHEVVAIEPVRELLDFGSKHSENNDIPWLDDSLPSLSKVYHSGQKFDLILVSAVWMHLPPSQHKRAFRKLCGLLNPGGKLVITLRNGSFEDGRTNYPVTTGELKRLATENVMQVLHEEHSPDMMGRTDVSWDTLVFQLPDDGTSALPLLRHIIVNDVKTSTYKLALLRILLRIADGSPGSVINQTASHVTLPLGLVALYWLRAYKSLLLDAKIHQLPKGNGKPGFAKDPFQKLHDVSPFDLKSGHHFQGEIAHSMYAAMKDIRDIIIKMPAHYTTYPGTDRPVFECKKYRMSAKRGSLLSLDQDFLASFGTFSIPKNLWDAMSQYACWIEPAIIGHWCQLMQDYDKKAGRNHPLEFYLNHLTWIDPERDTLAVREKVREQQAVGKDVYCIWSGRKIRNDYAIDHCFPFSYWPNNDAWNLLPSLPRVNSNKSNKLPSASVINDAKERMQQWWHDAYMQDEDTRASFVQEAKFALPLNTGCGRTSDLESIYQGVQNQRSRLRTFQQIMEWEG